MPMATLPALDLYYEVHGAPTAPPLVLVHGATETFRSGWQEQIPAFSRRYQVIGLDLRGHGRSTNPAGRLDLRQMADDVRDLLDYLGHDRVHLLGFSGGASVALFFATRHLARLWSLVLVSNNMELDPTRLEANFWDVERVRRQEPRWWASLAAMHELPVAQLLRWWAEEDAQRPDFTPAEMAMVAVPVLVVGGDRDPIVPLAETLKLFRALPDAYLSILPGMGHGAPRRRPLAFNQVVLDFLAYVEHRRHGGGWTGSPRQQGGKRNDLE